MKKLFCFLVVSCFFVTTGFAYDQEFVNAHEWMYTNEMTKYAQITDFQPEARVTREQAAKFFVAFDRTVMGRDGETEMYCVYSDEDSVDTTLMSAIQSACNRHLMNGSQGAFGPKEYLTKAQALAILIRSLQSAKDERIDPWRHNYFVAAQEAKLTKETNVYALDRPLTRYELALLLRRVQNPLPETQDDMADIGEFLKQL